MTLPRLHQKAPDLPPAPAAHAGRPGGAQARALCLLAALAGLTGCNADKRAAALLREADEALASQQWETAHKKAHEAAGISGASTGLREQAQLKEEQARSEQQARTHYAIFVGAADTEPDKAVSAYLDMPQASYYRHAGKDTYERIKGPYIRDHLEKAEQAFKNGRCPDFKAQLQMVLDVDGSNARAMELGKQTCVPAKAE